MSELDRAVDALVADHERAGSLSWDQIHRVTQRRSLDAAETAQVLSELSDLGLLPSEAHPAMVGIRHRQDDGQDEETDAATSKALVDGLSVFMQRASATPLLRSEDEVTLARRMRAGEAVQAKAHSDRTSADQSIIDQGRQAKAKFIESNLRLVFAWARRAEFQGQGLEYEDLIQAGIFGLIRAVEKFDPDLGYKFSTYAVWWIRQFISRTIADTGRTIRLPVHVQEDVRRIHAVQRRLDAELERPPTLRELSDEVDMDSGRVAFLLDAARSTVSLDLELDEVSGAVLGDLVASNDPPVEDEVIFLFLQEQLDDVFETLSEREAAIIKMRYGLIDDEPKTLDEIGRVYGVTRERIRQIEHKTMSKLRHPSRSGVLRDYLFDDDPADKRHRVVVAEASGEELAVSEDVGEEPIAQ